MTKPLFPTAGLSRRAVLAMAAGVGGMAVATPFVRATASSHAGMLDGTAPIALDIAETTAPLVGDRGPATAVFAFNGTVPGPVLRLPQGRESEIAVTNRLDQPTSVHWHGLRIANAQDGVAGMTQPAIAPGETFTYRFTPPDAGTYWYHPHIRTSEQLARGLHGPLIVTEETPHDFDDDRVLVLDDWRLNDQAQIDAASFGAMMDRSHAGRLGNVFTVNGGPPTDHPVGAGDRVRLRLINVANARVFTLDVSPLAASLIAVDGQPVPVAPAPDRIVLAPGQRVDLAVDIPTDQKSVPTIDAITNSAPYTMARFVPTGTRRAPDAPRTAFAGLPANPLPPVDDLSAAVSVTLTMAGGAMGGMSGGGRIGAGMPGMEGHHAQANAPDGPLSFRDLVGQGFVWTFNGVAGMPADPLITVRRDTPVILTMVNDTRWAHGMHLHGHHFQELSATGGIDAGTPHRDTILLQPGESRSVAFIADNPGDWMLHCHMIEHQDGGMASWIRVV